MHLTASSSHLAYRHSWEQRSAVITCATSPVINPTNKDSIRTVIKNHKKSIKNHITLHFGSNVTLPSNSHRVRCWYAGERYRCDFCWRQQRTKT